MSVESKTKSRPVAKIISNKEINESSYVREENGLFSYILTKAQEKIYLVNSIGIVVKKEKQGFVTNIFLDDGTSTIDVKVFEEKKELDQIRVGDTILSIAKVRSFNKIIYLAPEIIKIISPLWLKFRLKLFSQDRQVASDLPRDLEEMHKSAGENNKDLAKDPKPVGFEDLKLPVEKLIDLIERLDTGSGVFIEEIIEKSPISNTSKLLEKMLEKGDIFQNIPGKIKVL